MYIFGSSRSLSLSLPFSSCTPSTYLLRVYYLLIQTNAFSLTHSLTQRQTVRVMKAFGIESRSGMIIIAIKCSFYRKYYHVPNYLIRFLLGLVRVCRCFVRAFCDFGVGCIVWCCCWAGRITSEINAKRYS